MRKIILSFLTVVVAVGSVVVATKAAFDDVGEVQGTTFTVGNSDLKLLNDLLAGTVESNLVDTKAGPFFSNLFPGWVKDYEVMIYNAGSLDLDVTSESNYTTADDPEDLRSYINVEVFDWSDSNSNGLFDEGEETLPSLGKKTIIKWKTEGIPLGLLGAGDFKGLLLRFSLDTIPTTKQGQIAKYDFIFEGTTDGVTQTVL